MRATMNRLKYFGLFLVILSNSISALAMSNMQKADDLFNQRSHIQSLREAKEIYQKIIKDTRAQLSDRQKAMTRYGRLALFEGAVARNIFKITDKEAAKLFKTCVEVTDYLSPKNIKQDIAEYAYWRAACMGLRLANMSTANAALHMGNVKDMKKLVELGQKKFKEYDGYGFDRIEAGLLFKSEALKIMDLYDPPRALELINEIIERGTDIYMTYVLKAEIQQHLHNTAEAIKTLEIGILELGERFTNNSIPSDLIYENMIFMENMSSMKDELLKS
jgi:hypothetical protein